MQRFTLILGHATAGNISTFTWAADLPTAQARVAMALQTPEWHGWTVVTLTPSE